MIAQPFKWCSPAFLTLGLIIQPAALADIAVTQAPTVRIFNYKQSTALRLDPTRVAVRAATAPQQDAVPFGKVGGGWWLVPTPTSTRSAADVRAFINARVGGVGGVGALSAPYTAPVLLSDDGEPIVPTPDIIVGLVRGNSAIAASAVPAGTQVQQPWAALGSMRRARTTLRNGFAVIDAANALAVRPEIRLAEPDMIFTGTSDFTPSTPNDPFFSLSWHQRNTGQSGGRTGFDLDADLAWDWTLGRPGLTWVVIDSGVDFNHPEFAIRPDLDEDPLPGKDFTGDNTEGYPANGCDRHGTAVAGVVSARLNNHLGLTGLAPLCRLASARAMTSVCGQVFFTTSSWTIDALNWAVTIRARVTNNSNSYRFYSASVSEAYELTRAQGLIHFASAGNNNYGFANFPGNLPSVMSVAATNRFGNRASFSNYGYNVDLAAPGQEIITTDLPGPDGYSPDGYLNASGTSLAAPNAAGVALLILSIYPHLTSARVEEILRQSARPIPNWSLGAGMINARTALMLACPSDFNRDGRSDQADLAAFTTEFFSGTAMAGPGGYAVYPCNVAGLPGTGLNGLRADFNADCAITPEDLSQFTAGWFMGCQAVTSSLRVPMPPARGPPQP